MSGVLLLALLLGAAPPTQTATAPSAATSAANAPVPANVASLAALLNPEQPIVDTAVRLFETGFHGVLDQGGEGAQVFAEYPGLAEAIVEKCKPVVAQYTRASVPGLRDKSARFFMSRFSAAEIDDLLTFYRSPVGTKVIAGMLAGVDGVELATDLVNRGNDEVGTADVGKLMGGAVSKILPSFTDKEKADLIAFGQSATGKKLNSLQPEIMAFNTQIANEPDPEFDAALDKLLEEVVTDFIARHDAAKRTG